MTSIDAATRLGARRAAPCQAHDRISWSRRDVADERFGDRPLVRIGGERLNGHDCSPRPNARELALLLQHLPQTESTTSPAVASLDLGRENVTAIIWATGYNDDYDWLRVPVLDAQGRPLQQRGVSPVPGLYFLGLHWMHTIKSGLLSGVGNDAQHLAEQVDLTTR